MTSFWAELYGHKAMCVPLTPLIEADSAGIDYAFGVLILFQLTLFLLVTLGQVFIRISGKEPTVIAAQGEDSEELPEGPELLWVRGFSSALSVR